MTIEPYVHTCFDRDEDGNEFERHEEVSAWEIEQGEICQVCGGELCTPAQAAAYLYEALIE